MLSRENESRNENQFGLYFSLKYNREVSRDTSLFFLRLRLYFQALIRMLLQIRTMNIFAFTIGVLVSVFIILRFKKSRLENSKLAYPALLITFPFYYFAFAAFEERSVLALELLVAIVFFIIAILSIMFDGPLNHCLLAFGFILHGAYDVTHNLFFVNPGSPIWWPEFCGVIDVILGGYLAIWAFRSRVSVS